MLQGFFLMSVLYMIIGIGWDTIRRNPVALVTLYGLTFFFANYGPNTSTFILPSLVFEQPESRSTLNGICAACGKLGALIGATIFAPASQQFGDNVVMILCSVIATISFLITLWFVPDVSKNTNNNSPNQHQHNEEVVNDDTADEHDEVSTDQHPNAVENNYHFDDHQLI
jgi:PHS family inorganic phosphate transporter-like MFS transporter